MAIEDLNGTYSVAISAAVGSSLAILVLGKGRLWGNDVAGAKYTGTFAMAGDDAVTFDVRITLPPGVSLVSGTSPAEVFETREFNHTIPLRSFLDGLPITLPRESMTLMFRRVTDEAAPMAGQHGLRLMIDVLEQADAAWKAKG